MGINGSATAVLQFGDEGQCRGELVGTVEHQGMRQMFKMMNSARIAVGIQGVSLASSAYFNALDYAKERKQGSSISDWKNPEAPRVPIIEHPNVRRMLLDMKARVEGIRALIIKLTSHVDRARSLATEDETAAAYHHGQVDLLTPLVKAYSSDQSFRICETAIQVFGGAGYLQDHPVEQYCRDSKIFSIYEGTNSIQSMDLVGRKLGQAGGQHTQAFLGEVGAFVAAHKDHSELSAGVVHLGKAQEALAGGAMQFLAWFQAKEMQKIQLAAGTFLEMMSEVVIGWLTLDAAVIAIEKAKSLPDSHPDRAFYEGKKHSALYFALNVLPSVPAKAQLLANLDTSPVEMSDEAFGAA